MSCTWRLAYNYNGKKHGGCGFKIARTTYDTSISSRNYLGAINQQESSTFEAARHLGGTDQTGHQEGPWEI